MHSYPFLFWAYNVIWLGLAAYLALLFFRLARTRRRLERLERLLERNPAERDDRPQP